jgi:hypothetical protein
MAIAARKVAVFKPSKKLSKWDESTNSSFRTYELEDKVDRADWKGR